MGSIETAFARNLHAYVETFRWLGLGEGVDVLEMSDGMAACFGVGSPLTTVKGLPGNETNEQLREIETFFRTHGVPDITVELAPWSDTATQEVLAARGYVISGAEDVVMFTVADRALVPTSTTLEVTEISTEDFVEISRRGFQDGVGPDLERLLAVAPRLPGSVSLGVRCRDRMIACGQAVFDKDAMIFGNDNTLSDARRLGAQTALIRARLALGGGPIALAEVEPESGSERNYLRCGFEIAYTRTHFSRTLD